MNLLDDKLVEKLVKKAQFILDNKNAFPEVAELDLGRLVDLLYATEQEKKERDIITDSILEYNDEIVSIEELGEEECIDITVTGDNLFYANGILTKNSIGLPATCDLMLALISTEELEKMNQMMIKQLKNRFGDPNMNKRFVVGIDRSRMKIYDLDIGTQKTIVDRGDNNGKEDNGIGFGRQPRSRNLVGLSG